MEQNDLVQNCFNTSCQLFQGNVFCNRVVLNFHENFFWCKNIAINLNEFAVIQKRESGYYGLILQIPFTGEPRPL